MATLDVMKRCFAAALRWQENTRECFFFFFFTLITGPRRFLSLKLSDTSGYEPQIRARLGERNTPILGFGIWRTVEAAHGAV